MFKEKTIKCFEFDDVGYVVEVIETAENDFIEVEFWLQKKDYGVKSLMFGVFKKALLKMCDEHITYEDVLLDLIHTNILNHIRLYEDDYVDLKISRKIGRKIPKTDSNMPPKHSERWFFID